MSATSDTGTAGSSGWAPFRHRTFAVLWAATVLSNIGTWMHDVGAGWLMTLLAPSPVMVALVQTATALPVFFLAMPAGALADILDRRRILLTVQAAMGATALLFGLLVAAGLATSWLLLLFTFLLGAGAAFVAPAWQAIVPQLVPRDELQGAVALNSLGINISRAIGPALGGLLLAILGLAAPFLFNAASFLAVIGALLWWRPSPPPPASLPAERLLGAIRAGLRYARASGPLRATLIRAVAFFLFASAYWALLPLIVRTELGGGPGLLGLLMGAVGAGAVAGALLLPRLRARLGADHLVAGGTVLLALVLCAFAALPGPGLALLASCLAGAAWIAVLSSLNVSAQLALPAWVRARGLAVFLTVFFGAMSLGSLVWGQLAGLFGIPAALLLAAAGTLVMIPLTWPQKLHQGAALDLAPSAHWPAPILAQEVAADRGPVMVTVEYRVEPSRTTAFLAAMNEVAAERRRDGAYAWGLFEDAAEPGRWLEYFLVESWLEHLRQHERVTKADADLQARARVFHHGEREPVVTHWLAPEQAVSISHRNHGPGS
jgi:MFS family permease